MRYLSVCSGIEAATVAWKPLGMEAVAFSEIERFPSNVLAHHYPATPNLGDMNDFKSWPDAEVDVLVGGTPCQSFSVAGLRQGLADPRGNLALVYLAVADRYRPRWLVWENVPGVLSSHGGRDFGSIIGAMVKLGYGFAYRVLDAVHFGTPLRRRRVYVVAVLGDWRSAAQVLFDGAATDQLRETSAGIPCIDASGLAKKQTMPERSRCWSIHDGKGHRFLTPGEVELLMGFPYGYTAIPTRRKQPGDETSVESKPPIPDDAGAVRQHARGAEQSMPAMRLPNGAPGSRPRPCNGSGARDHLPPLQHKAAGDRGYGLGDAGVGIPGAGPIASDSARYKALGNSMAVPVMRWIGQRLKAFA